MKLTTKRELAARTLKVGKERIIFVRARLNEIKEAITKQDIRDLNQEGAILVKEIKGKKKKIKKKKKRTTGKIKKKINTRKQDYVKLTRKLRKHVAELKKKGTLNSEEAKEIRKKIRNKQYKSKSNLKSHLEVLKK